MKLKVFLFGLFLLGGVFLFTNNVKAVKSTWEYYCAISTQSVSPQCYSLEAEDEPEASGLADKACQIVIKGSTATIFDEYSSTKVNCEELRSQLVKVEGGLEEVNNNPCELGNGFVITDDCRDISIFVYLLINVGKYLFAIVGALVLLMLILGGFQLIISQGSPEKIKTAKDIILGAVIGLFVVFGAYALVDFLGDTLGVKKSLDINQNTSINNQTTEVKK